MVVEHAGDDLGDVYSGVTRTATFTVNPPAPTATLSSISVSPSSVTGGTGSTGTVTLSSGAPSGGAVVSLTSSNTAAANVPASVTVAAGATTATFAATTRPWRRASAVTITATYAGVTRTATLTVNPPGQAATLTVTATGRSGERVTSTPAGINVNVGTTGSAPFNSGHVDHAAGDERPRRDLVGRLFERRQQDEDLHVHVERQRHGQRERAVSRH